MLLSKNTKIKILLDHFNKMLTAALWSHITIYLVLKPASDENFNLAPARKCCKI
jgi:hypothetical protein